MNFTITILLVAITVVLIQLGLTVPAYIVGIAAGFCIIDSIWNWSKKETDEAWKKKVHPRLKKEYDEFDKVKPHYPKEKIAEYGKVGATMIGQSITTKEEEKWVVKRSGFFGALINASKATLSEIDKVFKR